MIPFSYEKYQSGNYRVVTRDGREVKGLDKNQEALKGILENTDHYWWETGRFNINKRDSHLDLFLIPLDEKKENTELKQKLTCPFCTEGEAKLDKEIRTHFVKDKILKGEFLFYKCDKCGEQFTTTESDSVSLQNFKHKKS